MIAQHHFKKDSKLLEKLGWARLTEQQPYFQNLKPYTQAQINKIDRYYDHIKAYYALSLFYKEVYNQ